MARRFTPQQLEAVVDAQLRDEMTAEETATAALAGELAGLPAFSISSSSCRTHAAEARRRALVERPVDADEAHRVAAVVDQALELLEAALNAERQKPAGELDVGRVKQIAKAAGEVGRLRKPAVRASASDAGEREQADDWLAQLAAQG